MATRAQGCEAPQLVIADVKMAGNEVTRKQVMLQELTFATGDTVRSDELDQLLEQNRKRLFNLRLFHHVNYAYTCNEGFIEVQYQVQERFYLYPVLIFDFADRNFNAWLEKKDWSRIDYGATLVRRNFRGRNEDVRVRVQRGFNKRLEFSYRMPYISRKHNIGAEVSVADYRSRTISYTNRNNRQYFYEEEEGLPIQRTSLSVGLIHRRSVQRQEGVRLSYLQEGISDSVVHLNPEYYHNALDERQYLRLELFKVVNLRNNFAYPLSGSYFEAGVAQSFFLKHSGTPFTTLRTKYANYSKLSEKYGYMVGAEGQLRLSKEYAFADNLALGFRSLVRGYELYVVGGQHYGVFKQGLTRELLHIKSITLNFIQNPKFNNIPLSVYLNAFTDAGYVVDNVFQERNPLTNRLLLGGGLGVHLVTFYDIVLRLEYTVNREGGRGVYFSTGFPF
ncbi:BamA/TamA family outer membrane protein [Pontibacter diazotrophicus]|uniref:BamA/TamA family outer membrane protein n=1 Tax=Pontibacter diazotrophicus TaxID=1400979 RepID=UPI001FE4BE4A|nr:BamA/TamA family outer membrane protein [Pontibacter diazotrophicus]